MEESLTPRAINNEEIVESDPTFHIDKTQDINSNLNDLTLEV